ncbi:MAG: ABC transporter permease, partial [Candidatus Bipolaricaulota bacterium]
RSLLGVTVHSALAIALVIAFAGWPGGAALGQVVLVLFVSVVGSYGLAFHLFGLTLRFKDAESLLSLVGNVAPLLGGVFFPVAFLPLFLRPLSYIFPFTYGVDALRALWLGTPAMFPLTLQLGLLGALAVAYVILGWWAVVHFERRARHHGLEGF